MSTTPKGAGFIYWVGIIAPVLMFIALQVLEHFEIKLGIGIPGIALVSLGICVVGVCSGNMNARGRMLLLVLAICAIPVEMLLLGVFSLITGGLSGTQ